jgi:RecA/RadA recombinase
MDDQKSKALAAALAQIEKQFGKGSIMKMGEAQIANDLAVVSTGSLGLDIALGVGGLPRGRVVEIYGPESSGKTTLCLQAVAQIQKSGGVAAYIDAENALDPVYAGKLGVNVADLLISQPDTGEQALEIADMLVRSGGGRCHRHRLRRGAGAEGGNRGGDGRPASRPAGAPDEPGAAQARPATSSVRARSSSSSTRSA